MVDTDSHVAFSPDGKTLACVAGRYCIFRDTQTGRLLSTRAGPHEDDLIRIITYSPDGSSLLASGRNGPAGAGGHLIFWDPVTGKEQRRWNLPECMVALSSDRRTLAAWKDDSSSVRLYDVASGNVISRMDHGAAVGRASFSPSGDSLATLGRGGVVRIWAVPTGRQLQVLKCPVADPQEKFSAAFSPDGRLPARLTQEAKASLARLAGVFASAPRHDLKEPLPSASPPGP
jgi:WD40 repeat protein